MNYSISEENYLKAIFHLQQRDGTVMTNVLAHSLDTRPASVTDMMKKLKMKRLVHYQPYKGFRLTAEGRKIALGIIRRHRLWEYFLAEKLDFRWDEVHAVAEELEHVSSRKLIDKLDAYLGFPKSDPHGDPIPDNSGRMENSRQISLAAFTPGRSSVVCKIGNQSGEMMELLSHRKIRIGTMIEVRKKFGFDNSVEIKITGQPAFTISEQMARNIYVKKSK